MSINYGSNMRGSLLAHLVNPAWMVLEYGWYPLLLFIATPYLLHSLGPEKYGHWMLLTAITGIGSILSTGTGAATIKLVSAGRGLADTNDVELSIRSSLAIAVIGGGLLSLLIFVTFWFAGEVFFLKMGDRSLLRLTGGVGALLAWIEQIDHVFASAFKGAEQFGKAAQIEMTSRTAQIALAVLAVATVGSIGALYATLFVVTAIKLVAKSWMVMRLLALSTLRPAFKNVPDILYYAKWGWLQGTGGLFFGIADRLLVGSFLGAASLAYYSVASQLAQQIHALSSAAFSVLFPKISRKMEEEAHFSLSKVAKVAGVLSFTGSGALVLGLLIFGRQILTLWLGSAEAEASAQVLWYLTIAYGLMAINVVPHFILLGLGRMQFLAMSNLVAGVILLVLMFVLVQPYELVGIGVARIVYGIIILVNFIPLVEYLWREHEQYITKTETKSSDEVISNIAARNDS